MRLKITAIDLGRKSFQNSYSALSDEIKSAFKDAYRLLMTDPQPKKLRLEKLSGCKRPGIYTIHITPNHSHKLSFELVGTVAELRRIGTHKEIDRAP
ncbi:hypothetical protein BI292_06135 [Pseudomonas sp. 43NM1]|nr:hypothetical protein BI292_06135 [Pseudomonas sp. 43NM1]